MSRELLYYTMTKMFVKLNTLIEIKDYNLLDKDIQKYSRKLDRLIIRYNKLSGCRKAS